MSFFDIQNGLGNFSFFILLVVTIFYWIQISFSHQLPFSKGETYINHQKENIGYNLPLFKEVKVASIATKQKNTFFVLLAVLAKGGMILANLSLAALLIIRWLQVGHYPLSNLYESLVFLSLSVTTFHLLFQSIKNNKIGLTFSISDQLLGCITAPLALFINAFATFTLPIELQKENSLVPALQSNWLVMHVTIMIVSYAALMIGSLLSIVFLIVTLTFKNSSKNELLKVANSYIKDVKSPITSKTNKGSYEDETLQHTQLSQFNKQNKVVGVLLNEKNSEFASLIKDYNSSTNLLSVTSIDPSFKNLLNSDQTSEMMSKAYAIKSSPFSFKGSSSDVDVDLKQNNTQLKEIDAPPSFSVAYPYSYPLKEVQKGVHTQQTQQKKLEFAQNLDALSYQTLGVGFPLLTLGILSGAVWANQAWGSYWNWDPKETWALITWLVFAIYFHTRLKKGWEGKKSAIVASLGFVVIWICYLGVNLYGKGLHSYGWFAK